MKKTACHLCLKISYFIIFLSSVACQEKPKIRYSTRYQPKTTSDKFEVRKNKENIESIQVPDSASSFYIHFNTGINIMKVYVDIDNEGDTTLLYDIFENSKTRKPPYGFAHRESPYYSMTYMKNGKLKCEIKQNDSHKERRIRIEYMVGYNYFDKFYIYQEGKSRKSNENRK